METKVFPPPLAAASSSTSSSSSSSSSSTTITSSSPPTSCGSSPSHEFSFTISFHPSPLPPKTLTTTATAIDLSPADEIFFHGHLLPLQFLSHAPPPNPPPPPISPRLSSFHGTPSPTTLVPAATITTTNGNNNNIIEATNKEKIASKPTSKPFYCLFSGARGRTRKPEEEEKKKRSSFDVGRILKKYAVVLETLLFSRGSIKDKRDLRRRPYTFSGSSNWKGREEWIEKRRKRWGQLSAPASMRTSPTNSGRLQVSTAGVGSSEESTMEELQNAIQAAIAHCKNSIATNEEKRNI